MSESVFILLSHFIACHTGFRKPGSEVNIPYNSEGFTSIPFPSQYCFRDVWWHSSACAYICLEGHGQTGCWLSEEVWDCGIARLPLCIISYQFWALECLCGFILAQCCNVSEPTFLSSSHLVLLPLMGCLAHIIFSVFLSQVSHVCLFVSLSCMYLCIVSLLVSPRNKVKVTLNH